MTDPLITVCVPALAHRRRHHETLLGTLAREGVPHRQLWHITRTGNDEAEIAAWRERAVVDLGEAARVRNLLLERVTTPYVAFCDDDDVPGGGWLEHSLHGCEAAGGAIICARWIIPPEGSPSDLASVSCSLGPTEAWRRVGWTAGYRTTYGWAPDDAVTETALTARGVRVMKFPDRHINWPSPNFKWPVVTKLGEDRMSILRRHRYLDELLS